MTDRGTRVRAVGLGVLAVAFVMGVAVGVAGTRVLGADDGDRDRRRDDDGRRGGYVFEKLDLTETQRAQIDSVLEVRRMQVEAFWDTAGPRMREIVDSTRAGIEDVLTPEQRDEYERLLKEARDRRRDDDREDDRDERGHDDDRRDGGDRDDRGHGDGGGRGSSDRHDC